MKTLYLNILAICLLTGCTSTAHQLVKGNDIPFVGGELVYGSGEDSRLVLEAQNRRYEARGFSINRQTNLAELRKRYHGSNPKHWKRIFSGLDTDHVTYSVETIATSSEGDKVSCSLVWERSARPAGACTDQAGAELPVRFN